MMPCMKNTVNSLNKDRQLEMKERERRAQKFMNKMADNFLQKMDKKQKFEDDMLLRYENEREMR